MKTLVLIGAFLIVLGAIGLVYGGLTYTRNQETTGIGPVDITVQENERLQIHPVLGGVIAGTGLVVLLIGASRKSA
jgi:hypothetical protein